MELTAAEIARRLGALCEGDGSCVIRRMAGIRDAGPGDISFVANTRYAADAANTRASAVVVGMDWTRPCAAVLIRAENPEKAFAQVAEWFMPPPIVPAPGIHPTAIVAKDARLGSEVSIGPYCIIEPGAAIGDRTILFAHGYIGHETEVGADCRFYPHVTARERVTIGDRVIIHNGTVIGSDGFGYTVDEKGERRKIPQIGIVEIGDDVEIGANVTVDRARFGTTRIGKGVKIDNLVQIAHNVVIGDHAVIVAQAGVAGSTVIGSKAILAGQAGIAGHLVIGAGAIVGAQAGVTKNVAPKTFVSGYPAAPHDKATRIHAHLMHLPELKEHVAALEARLRKLEGQS
ncbi:MAG: UDP-3-O-(3-hydroxymyristoyl)glucosamine N-acyltransferase [Kiritimatiellae bacterium]|nr:UDP-3-O-(3-hydroxymyristoyl)glucosamine N-acyltransferase [Kiritimatiellia bacterium]